MKPSKAARKAPQGYREQPITRKAAPEVGKIYRAIIPRRAPQKDEDTSATVYAKITGTEASPSGTLYVMTAPDGGSIFAPWRSESATRSQIELVSELIPAEQAE